MENKEGLIMKRIRNQLRIHWGWLKKKEDYNEVADWIDSAIRQVLGLKNDAVDNKGEKEGKKQIRKMIDKEGIIKKGRIMWECKCETLYHRDLKECPLCHSKKRNKVVLKGLEEKNDI